MEVEIDLAGIGETEKKLVQLLALTTDLRPFWPRLIPLFVGWMREQFATEGEWGGDPWEPLAQSTLISKERMGYGSRGILYATGDLRRAASLPKRRVTPSSLEIIVDDSSYSHGRGSARSVAGYHQDGTARMPARPIIPEILPESAQVEIYQAAEEYVDEMVARLGLSETG